VIRQGLIVTNSVRVGKRTLRRLPDGQYHYPEIWGHSRGSMSALAIMRQLTINPSMDFGRAYSTLAHLPKEKSWAVTRSPRVRFGLN
jgi:hypothetical protein